MFEAFYELDSDEGCWNTDRYEALMVRDSFLCLQSGINVYFCAYKPNLVDSFKKLFKKDLTNVAERKSNHGGRKQHCLRTTIPTNSQLVENRCKLGKELFSDRQKPFDCFIGWKMFSKVVLQRKLFSKVVALGRKIFSKVAPERKPF